MIYLQLFYEFFITGLFAFGGGLATLPFLYNLSDKTGWFSYSNLADMIAISESTPGPIGVNMATYAGFQTTGVLGGIVATIGLITPSIIVILIIYSFLKRFSNSRGVKAVFYGLRPASCGMIAAAGFSVIILVLFGEGYTFDINTVFNTINIKALVLGAILFVLIRKVKIHPIFFLLGAAVVGILIKL